jgi:hypothetical protein
MLQHGLYALGMSKPDQDVALSATQKLTLAQAHKVLGHIHYRTITEGIRIGNIEGIELSDTKEVFCEVCVQAKLHHKPFPQEAKNCAKEFGDQTHMDMWGPASVKSIGKKKYSLDFKDDATRWTTLNFLAKKDKAFWSYCTYV